MFLFRISKVKFYAYTILWSICLVLFGSFLISVFVNPAVLEIDALKNKSLFFIFITTVVIAPLIETLIYQYAIIELIVKLRIKYKTYIALIISSVLFGVSHNYNTYYSIIALLLGGNFAALYLIAKKRGDIRPFLFIFILHSVINLVAFLINDLFRITP